MFCDCKYSVALPRGAVSWSAVCDCGFPDHTRLLFVDYKLNFGEAVVVNYYFSCQAALTTAKSTANFKSHVRNPQTTFSCQTALIKVMSTCPQLILVLKNTA